MTLILCGMGPEVRSAGYLPGQPSKPWTAKHPDSSSWQHHYKNLQIVTQTQAILAWVPRDAGKRHGSPTSAPGWCKLQIGVVVEAVIVRVS